MAKTVLEQWVNLDKDPKWVEDDITSEARVGHLHFEAKFSKGAKLVNFKIKVKEQPNNATYNAQEKARNLNFTVQQGAGAASNLSKKTVKLERNVSLPAAGGNEYIVRAKYKQEQVESTKAVAARRRLFYYSVKMDSATLPAAEAIGDPATILTNLETDYWDPAKNYYLKLVKKGDATMALTKCLLMGEEDETGATISNSWGATRAGLLADAKTALAGSRPDLQKRKPFNFVSVWCNYIATKGKTIINQEAVTATGAVASATLPSWFGKLFGAKMANQTIYVLASEFLWHGLDDTDDANQNWLETVELDFEDAAGARSRIAIPNNRVTIADAARFAFGGHAWLQIDLTDADMAGVRRRVFGQVTGRFRLRVKVRTVAGWTLGFAVPATNVIVVADKSQWQTVTDSGKKYVLNHEFGHKIGMTSQGGAAQTFNNENAANMPDAPASLYGNIHLGPTDNSRGHTGNHCGEGATWTAGAFNAATNRFDGTWTGAPACVMFGMDGVWDTATNTIVPAPPGYCANCEPIVRKLDLGNAMLGFASCVTD
ncbi:MAG: hypothetical protein HY908_25415 [Myxococcales bacterium]|nr:hypothetical protein [Myxococcales bacterium]